MNSNRRAYVFGITARAVLLALAATGTLSASFAQNSGAPEKAKTVASAPSQDTLLEASALQAILPPSVFFKGQSAPLQLRNASGIRFADGAYLFASLVDTSGYSSGVQEKYQAYFITEVPLRFSDHTLSPGAYGVGFIADNKFLVMDIGGHDLFTVSSTRDEALRHPTPLKIVQAPEAGSYRLYAGRSFVTYTRAE